MNRQEKVARLQEIAESSGFFIMYGGKKGHGFWMYRATNEWAKKEIAAGRGINLVGKAGLENIQNNGSRSGNPHFWMFDEAKE